MRGVVERVERAKGFGFIRDEEGMARFFHSKSLVGTHIDFVREGMPVTFEPISDTGKGNGLAAGVVRVDA